MLLLYYLYSRTNIAALEWGVAPRRRCAAPMASTLPTTAAVPAGAPARWTRRVVQQAAAHWAQSAATTGGEYDGQVKDQRESKQPK